MLLLSVVMGVMGVSKYLIYIIDSLYNLDSRKPLEHPEHIYKPTPLTDFLTPQTGSKICGLWHNENKKGCLL